MTPEQIDNLVRKLSNKEGFVDYGAAKYEKLEDETHNLRNYVNLGYHADMQYLVKNISLREDPSLLLEGVKSILCFLAPYKPSLIQSESLPKIASYAYGTDYHKVVRDKLYNICNILKESIPDVKYRVFCDSAPLLERAWAARAGLGFIGKSTFLISKRYGLHTIIGVVLLDREVSYGEKGKDSCGTCTRCIDACPSGALVSPRMLDARRCISYQTIESPKMKLEEDYQVDKRNWIFGCDICLNACPWASKGEHTTWDSFKPLKHGQDERLITEISNEEWISMDEESFSKWFSDSPLMRAGLNKIKDNI